VRPPSRRAVRSAALALASFAVLTVGQVLYQGGDPSYRTIWAEDGKIHYQAIVQHGLRAFAIPDAGYLEVISRLLALPATWLPVDRLAVYFSVAGAATGALVALAVYRLTDQAIGSRVLRVALALAVALHPVLLPENLANITNIIWVLCFAVFWALTRRPRTTGDVALGAVVAFLGTASLILSLLFVPVAAYVAWTRRDWRTRVVVAAYGVGALVQTVAYLTASDHGPHTPGRGGLVTLYIARVLGLTAVGAPETAHLWNDGGRGLLFPVALIVVVLVAVLLACSRGKWLALAAVTLAYSVLFFALPLLVRGDETAQLGAVWNDVGARYAVIPVLFVVASIAILIPHARIGRVPRSLLAWGVLTQIAVVIVLGFHTDNFRSNGPEWYPALVAQARRCPADGRGSRFVVTTPGAPWGIRLSCSQLRSVGS